MGRFFYVNVGNTENQFKKFGMENLSNMVWNYQALIVCGL